jgi:hypothetical protein
MDWRGAEETGARQIKERLCALNSIITERASSKRASGLSPLRLRRDVAIMGRGLCSSARRPLRRTG